MYGGGRVEVESSPPDSVATTNTTTPPGRDCSGDLDSYEALHRAMHEQPPYVHFHDSYLDQLPTPRLPEDESVRYAAESVKGIITNFVSSYLQGLIPPDQEILALHKIGAIVNPRGACVNHVAIITRNGEIKEGLIPDDERGRWNFEAIEHIDKEGNLSPGFMLARGTVTVKHGGILVGKLFDRLSKLMSSLEASGARKKEITKIKTVLDMRNNVENSIVEASRDIAPELLTDTGKA
jgi:hypothetical protein